MAATEQYECTRVWRHVDPHTGAVTDYEVGDPYEGPLDYPYLLDPQGPDGKGPLIKKKAAADKPGPFPSGDTGSKEKK